MPSWKSGTDRRSPVETHGASHADTRENGLAKEEEASTARSIAGKAIGDAVHTVDALVDGGTYRGLIVGETERHLVQRQSAGMAVLHRRELLDRQPQVGEVFSINYSNGKGFVREARDRAKSQELSR